MHLYIKSLRFPPPPSNRWMVSFGLSILIPDRVSDEYINQLLSSNSPIYLKWIARVFLIEANFLSSNLFKSFMFDFTMLNRTNHTPSTWRPSSSVSELFGVRPWTWRDQDGGEGHVGTVVKLGSNNPEDAVGTPLGWVKIRWDNGYTNNYQAGSKNNYDMLLFDNAPAGLFVCFFFLLAYLLIACLFI